jgi:arginine decarboxylase
MIPRKVFFTKGTGHGFNEILSFENALREAHISRYNLVTVSSILPPKCKIVSLEEGISELSAGQIVYLVLSRITVDNSSSTAPERIFASIGVAKPNKSSFYGYVAENNGVFTNLEEIDKTTSDLATTLLVTSSKGSEQFEIETTNITNHTYTNKQEKYTTCIAAAVFIK